MELTVEACDVLSPNEMRILKKEAAVTLKTLSERSRVSMPQLSEFMGGKNGLRVDQVQACAEVLIAAARERSMALAKLLADDQDAA